MLSDNQGAVKSYDAIVIGAGISGLTAALLLAKEGKSVAVFERDGGIAPLIRPYKRLGCEFSPGLHICGWMGDGEILSRFLEYLNIGEGVERCVLEEGYGVTLLRGARYHIPRGYGEVEKALASYFPESAEAVSRYIGLMKEVNEQSFYFNHALPAGRDRLDGFVEMANYSLRDCLKKYNASQELVDMLGVASKILIGSGADEVPFMVYAFLMGGFYRSPGYFSARSINRLLANFKSELAAHGADLFTSADVDEILTGGGREVAGVSVKGGGHYLAPVVIASNNPKLLNETVKNNVFRPAFRRRLEDAEDTGGMYVAYYRVDDTCNAPAENITGYDEGEKTVFGVIWNRMGGKDEPVIISVFLMDDAARIPDSAEGRSALAAVKFQVLEKVLFEAQPGLKGGVRLLDFLKPWSFERYTRTFNGSAYGIKQTINAIGFQNRAPLGGLYIVGQAVYPGFLGSMISSFSLAIELNQSENLWAKVVSQ